MTDSGGVAAQPPAADPPAGAPLTRRHRRFRRLLRWLSCLTLLFLAGVEVIGYAITGRVAEALVRGPNAGRVMAPGDDSSPSELQALGVDRQFRVDAGPPAASLSVWVLEPKVPEPKALEPKALEPKVLEPKAPAPPEPATRPAGAVPSAPVPRGTLVLLHGHMDRKEQLLDAGQFFAAAGYRVVLIDMRSRGRSGGQYLTFGFREARDTSQVLDALDSRGLLPGPVGVFGRSYGGATAIQLAAIDSRVGAVVALSSFSSMREAIHDASRAILPGPVRLLLGWRIDPIIDRAGLIAGFDPDQASPLRAIARTRVPVLLMHGTADGYVPPDNSRRLHDAAPGHSELILIEDKDHASVMDEEAQPVVVRAARDWFDRHLPPAGRWPGGAGGRL